MSHRLTHPEYLKSLVKSVDLYTFHIRDRPSLEQELTEIAGQFQNESFSPRLAARAARHKSIVWQAATFADTLAIRHLDRQLRFASGIVFPDRQVLVRQLAEILRSDRKGTMLRTDIHRCFRNIDPTLALDQVSELPSFGYRELNLLEAYLLRAGRSKPTGLPWGIATSSTIAEIVLASFDRKCRCIAGVTYYARFADDILLVSSSLDKSQLHAQVQSLLPSKMSLSVHKTHLILCAGPEQSFVPFEFLGYSFAPLPKKTVAISMAKRKVDRIKYRIVRTIEEFQEKKNLFDLRDRLRLITGHVTLRSRNHRSRIRVGIYFSYRLVTTTTHLCALDSFLRRQLKSVRHLILAKRGGSGHYKSMKRYSFHAGFHKQITHTWGYDRLARLRRAWRT